MKWSSQREGTVLPDAKAVKQKKHARRVQRLAQRAGIMTGEVRLLALALRIELGKEAA